MFPHIQIFLRQMLRGKARLVLNLVLLCAATAFFVVSLNLYHNSRANLQMVENAYTTLATMEIYGDVNAEGELVSPGADDCVGRFLLTRYGYDLSPILQQPFVKDVDLRYRCAAYIPNQVSVYKYAQEAYPDENNLAASGLKVNDTRFGYQYNMFRFKINGDEPIEIDLTKESSRPGFAAKTLDVTITASVYPQIQYEATIGFSPRLINDETLQLYGDEIRRLNRTDDAQKLIFYPDVEYIVEGAFNMNSWYRYDETLDRFVTVNYGFQTLNEFLPANAAFSLYGLNCTYTGYDLRYRKSGEYFQVLYEADEAYQIQRWDDVQSNPEEAAYWDALWQANLHSVSSFAVTLTDDISSIPAWHAGGMYLNQGRMILKEEYQNGAKVCMISAELAEKQGWQVGDKLDMHLYEFQAFQDHGGTDTTWSITKSIETEGFFDEGQYEIVGIYGQREITDIGDTAPEVFSQPWNAIYIPEKSAPHAPALEDRPIQPSLLTLTLKNGTVKEFQAAVEELGLTEQESGQYQLKFSYFDQGYDKIKPALEELNRNAKILLGLSAVLLVVTMVLLAFLFSRQHKPSAGILRLLGGSKKQAFTAIFTCAAVVVLVGGVVGAIAGGVLTQSVGASTLGDTADSAKVAFSTSASPLLTALSGLGCVALFLLLTAIFTGTYIGKEPRSLLPQDKG